MPAYQGQSIWSYTAHTVGLSATGFPLCVMFEREDEAQSQVYERMCKKMFGGRTDNGHPNLQGMFVFVFVFVFVYLKLFILNLQYNVLFSFNNIGKLLVPIKDTGLHLFYFCFYYSVVLMLLVLLPVAFGILSLLQKGSRQQQ